jgi:hypothetical protein
MAFVAETVEDAEPVGAVAEVEEAVEVEEADGVEEEMEEDTGVEDEELSVEAALEGGIRRSELVVPPSGEDAK